MLEMLQSILPHHMWQWLAASMAGTELPVWVPFHCNDSLPAKAQLGSWQKHAKFPACVSIPECLGVRAVKDLQHVFPEVQLTVMRPVQQARLRWAVRGYQDQLAQERNRQEEPAAAAGGAEEREPNLQERAKARQKAIDDERPAAQVKVAAAFGKFGGADDVHGFVQELSQFYGKLDTAKLPPKPVHGAADWKDQMLKSFHAACIMAHLDKCPLDAPASQRAMALEVCSQLTSWKTRFREQH